MTRPWDARRLRRAACVVPVAVTSSSMCWLVRGTRWAVLASTAVGMWSDAYKLRGLPPARSSFMTVTALPAHGWPLRGWPSVSLDVDTVLELMTVLACAGDRLRSWDIKQRITVLEIFTGSKGDMRLQNQPAVTLTDNPLYLIARVQQIHDHCLAYEAQLDKDLP